MTNQPRRRRPGADPRLRRRLPRRRERPADPAPLRIWLILGDKAGDNAQVRIVADTLGWPYVVKQLVFRAPYVIGKPRFRASLYHVDRARSAIRSSRPGPI